jgi:pimeloyl-ACP methyl ester carboxylesterase
VSEPEALYLIPGLGSDATVWAETVAALGLTADTRIADTFSDDTLAAMAGRLLRAAPPRFALAGLSMGGMVALEVIRQAPERVTRLALFDTTAAPDDDAVRIQRVATRDRLLQLQDFGTVPEAAWSYLVHPAAVARVADAMTGMMRRVSPASYARQINAVLVRDDLRPVLPRIAVPTIVVIGAEDRVTPRPLSDALVAGIVGARLIVIPECGHLPPLEKPQETAQILADWLLA